MTRFAAAQPLPSPSAAPRMGAWTVIVGCMFSGKTTRLLAHLSRFAAREVLAFKHVQDLRYHPEAIVSHDGASHPCHLIADVRDIGRFLTPEVRCIAIDEGHFFPGQILEAMGELRRLGLEGVITALDRNSWGRPIPHMAALVRRADRPVLCRASCGRCGQAANRTQRLTPIIGGNIVGGPGDYEPRCVRCWRPPADPPVDPW